jgi:N-acetylmuramoyl-L-alanine amidase
LDSSKGIGQKAFRIYIGREAEDMRVNNKMNKLKYIVCLATICFIIAAVPMYNDVLKSVEKITSADVIVIDPGHGGLDGGAESAGGVSEKNINLAIAKELEALAKADGWNVVMTRDEDISLGEEAKGSIRSKKTKDLLERKRIISEIKPTATVSIHLNSFKEDRSVHGAQVFYPAGSEKESVISESKRLAEIVQGSLTKGIADGTDRTALSKSGVLILKNPSSPIIIVECGFLSNKAEADLLQSKEYQKKIAACVYEGIMTFSNKEVKKDIKIRDSL